MTEKQQQKSTLCTDSHYKKGANHDEKSSVLVVLVMFMALSVGSGVWAAAGVEVSVRCVRAGQ
jgi:hypothetical protein